MKRTLVLLLCLAAAVVILMATGMLVSEYKQWQNGFYTDGDTIHQPRNIAASRDILWQPPVALPDFINTQAHEYEPRLAADGQTLYFVRGKAGGNADIFISHRVSQTPETWSQPEPLAAINSTADELGPVLSANGELLIFYSNRPGGMGGYDLWISRRAESGWQTPMNLGAGVNSEHNEYGAALSVEGSRIYFASNRPRPGAAPNHSNEPWPATLRETNDPHDFDIYSATFRDGEVDAVSALDILNSPQHDGAPALSPAGDFIYFTSNCAGGHGGFDIYRSRILRGEHEAPENIGAEINSAANELDPALSIGGFGLHFSSDRTAANTNAAPSKEYNLYYSASREVFIELAAAEPLIDWASLLDLVLPSLLWLLLALLALFALLALLRGMQSRRLSLLARCLLASLLVHVILMMLFTVWQVTTSLREAFERSGTQVALTSHAAADDLALQIRGGFTEGATPADAPLMEKTEVALAALSDAAAEVQAELPVERIESAAPEPIQVSSNPAESSLAPNMPQMTATPLNSSAPPVEVAMPSAPIRAVAADPALPAIAAPSPASSARASSQLDQTHAASTMAELNPPPSEVEVTETAPLNNLSVAAASESLAATQFDLPMTPRANEGPSTVIDVAVPSAPAIAAPTEPDLNASAPPRPAVSKVETSAPLSAGPSSPREIRSTPAAVSIASTDVQQPLSQTAPRESVAHSSAASEPSVALSSPPAFEIVQVDGPAATASESVSVESSRTPEPTLAATVPDQGLPSSSRRSTSLNAPAPARESVQLQPESAAHSAVATLEGIPASGASRESMAASSDSALNPSTAAAPDFSPLSIDVAIPLATAPATQSFAQRDESVRRELVQRMGGSEATERAVALALQWLAAHQDADGRWAAKRFDDNCGECRNPAKFDTDIATTALALLCFFAADHTHQKDGPYRSNVERGLIWMLAQQKPDGDWRGGETMYSHGIAAIAVAEVFGMTRDQQLASPAQRAANYIVAAANEERGGWRYEPGQVGDTSVLGWQVMALISARRAGFDVPDSVLESSRQWLETVSSATQPGRYAYQPGHRHTPSMTAEAMFSQQLLGMTPDQPRMQASAKYLMENLPRWKGNASTYYWYYATLAMFQHQGESWTQWNEALTEQLLAHQRTDGAAAGSWDPVDNWSKVGGRVYQTALCTLSLEVYYRYLPMYSAARDEQSRQ